MPDPNPVNVTPYLTVIPDRTPEQKLHRTLGHAKSAISNRIWQYGAYRAMQLFEFKDGQWVLMYSIPEGMRKDDLPWK